MTFDLYGFQLKAIAESERYKRPLIVAPTGAGKTIIACGIIHKNPHKHVLFLAHRRELIFQARDKLASFGVYPGVILAGELRQHMRAVQIASVQTLDSRCIRGDTDLPPADVVFIDEAHHCRARTYQKIVASYPDARIIGLTATPCRKDGRGLGGTFETLIECPQVSELIDLKHLVRTKVFAPSTPNLKGVHVRKGDYVESELAARVDRPELVGDIVSHWLKLAERRKTVVFATSVAHSIHLRDEFVKSGVRAAHIDGDTPKNERDEILGLLSEGAFEAICNCMVLTEGWDQPDVSCCVLARPTKSLGLYRQMVGRVLRPAPGKADALILDHAGAVFQHGFVEDPVYWTLDPDDKAANPEHESRGNRADRELCTCSQCSAVRTAGKPCPNCGFLPRRPGEYLRVIDGDLAHVSRDGRVEPNGYSPEQRQEWHQMLTGIAQDYGYKPGWVAYQYKAKFGFFPPWGPIEPLKPSQEVRAWVRSKQIAYAKAMQKAGAHA
jgi:DNA repair protein RadD